MQGVVFPQGPDGRRSSTATGRAVVAEALSAADPALAAAARDVRDWRRGYLGPFRDLVTAGLQPPDAAVAIARRGVAALHERMRVLTGSGEAPLAAACTVTAPREVQTVTAPAGTEVERGFSLPYQGRRLSGDDLHRRLDAWVAAGTIEPSCAEAVRTVAANPDWLDLSDRTVVVLGAGAEMGPLHAVLRWGGTVAGVDLPRPGLWERVLGTAARYGGRLLLPAAPGPGPLPQRLGLDLLHDLPTVAGFVSGLDGPLVLGNYVYAPGATYLRVSAACDALTAHLLAERPGTALAFLGTPTDVYAVPPEAVDAAGRAAEARAVLRAPLRLLSGGRLLRPTYPDGPVNDSLVPQQGPNYALAKRLQRWRAADARAAGVPVAFSIAPPTRTRSVVRNRALAAAYAGAHRFGIEVFEPATSNTLMAALLVHHLRAPRPAGAPVWQDEAFAAAHGGLWRIGYQARSALGLAALIGFATPRG
ncbi:hypothetical protein [Spirilliplanes yamanashiensis]|uniref:Uncharacterized protein n=1 Tax=Spirilliplanes yamanashiensis TaxID=42233 RepID=A0A8J4DJJ1_9ACTN|nr:hypothetical protein [Spirilliplanes yamanashiensis]MDP9817061.1 hypothetical protein [Spirilliplanes yamanashiensis]GIJ03283.1 hypothetical protein Sya03_26350 [Spirilliplanes yamanashiensis]